MEYNSATDSYESEFLESILDTNFKYGVPYKIDREVYENAFKKFNKDIRIKDADVVVFHAGYTYYSDEEGGVYSYTFYTWPKNSPEESEDFYDCAQFYGCDYGNKCKETFEDFVHAVLESVISPDKQYSEKLIAELQQEIDTKMKNIELLKNII